MYKKFFQVLTISGCTFFGTSQCFAADPCEERCNNMDYKTCMWNLCERKMVFGDCNEKSQKTIDAHKKCDPDYNQCLKNCYAVPKVIDR